MKNILFGSLALLFALCISTFNQLRAQTPTPIAFGETIVAELPLTSSTKSFSTPAVQPGDILFLRAVGLSMDIKVEIFSPLGQKVAEANPSFVGLGEIIHPIPVNGESGVYRILISNDGVWTGSCCLSLERMNASPVAQFLGCDQSLNYDMPCDVSIKSYRFLATQGMISRIVVDPDGLAPKAWVCAPDGAVLKTGKKSYAQTLILDSIYAANTGCYYVYVVDDEGDWDYEFSISHSSLFGSCPGVAVQSSPANATVCAGNMVTLSAEFTLPGATYSWSGPNGFSASQSEITLTNLSESMAGNYSVTVTHPSVCSSVATKTVVVRPLPVIDAVVLPNPDTCAPGNVQLQVNLIANAAGASYQWRYPDGSPLTGGIYAYITNAGPEKSGYYKIQITNANGCASTDSVLVNIFPAPSVNISAAGGENICLGKTLQLNVTTDAPNALYNWTGPGGFQSSSQSPVRPNVSFSEGGTYYVTVTNAASGCTASGSFYVQVRSLPTANIFGAGNICAGDSLTLTASGANTYIWSNGATGANIVVKPLLTTVYVVTVTNTYGCTDTESASVGVKPLPSASISSTVNPPEICSGTGTILLCAGTNAQNPVFTWNGPGLNSSQQCVSLGTPNQSGAQTLKVKDGISGCANYDTIAVAIYATPTANILEDPATAHCSGDDFIVCATSNASSPNYVWSIPGGTGLNQICLPINNCSLQNSGLYAVTITDLHGCSATAQKNINIRPAPTVQISGELKICAGSTSILLASGASTYVWNTGDVGNQLSIMPGITQTYTVTGTDAFGCKGSNSATVEVAPNTLQITASVVGNTIQANAFGGQAPYTYSIYPPAQSPNSTGFFPGLPAGNYTVTATDDFGCSKSFSSLLVVTATVEPASEWGIVLSPNPTAGAFWLQAGKLPAQGLDLALFDAAGRQIRQFSQKNESEQWNLDELPVGLYFLRVTDGERTGMLRLLKIRP